MHNVQTDNMQFTKKKKKKTVYAVHRMLKNVKILCGPLWKRLDCCTNWESVDNDMVQHTISKHSSSKSSSTL